MSDTNPLNEGLERHLTFGYGDFTVKVTNVGNDDPQIHVETNGVHILTADDWRELAADVNKAIDLVDN
jgi:hypothetical protein